MPKLKAATRKRMPKKAFAGPGRSFPINDAEHAKLAIGGATRSERAGNINEAQEATIKSEARAKLNGGAKQAAPVAENPRKGARDGMGSGKGGLAVHSSAKGAGMHGDSRTMRHERY